MKSYMPNPEYLAAMRAQGVASFQVVDDATGEGWIVECASDPIVIKPVPRVNANQLGISLRFIRAYDPATDFLFVPGRVNRPYPREADEPKVTADVAAYLDVWFAK